MLFNSTKKLIRINTYTICSSNQLGLEVERPEWSTYILLFSLFYTIKEIFLVFMRFLQPPYMKFPTSDQWCTSFTTHLYL